MIITKLNFFLLNLMLLGLITSRISAQNCSISGSVLDKGSNNPIQYANAIVTSPADSSLLMGAITNEEGKFFVSNLKEGKYNLKLSFIGYETVMLENIYVKKGQNQIETVTMDVLKNNLKEVTVKATKQAISYKVDKKVIDASSFPAAQIAMDLLENVPSVQVDFEGKLTYRGDGTFKVFINGHPVANGEDKLRQIPADRIDKIEIITNPSAKYDAEGTAGIIQIILKHNRLQGYSINSNIKASTLKSYSWDFSIDQKGEKGGWYINGQISEYFFNQMTNNEIRIIEREEHNDRVESIFDEISSNFQNYIEFGCNYDITPKDYVDFSIYATPLNCKESRDRKGNSDEYASQNDQWIIGNSYELERKNDISYSYLGATFKYEHAFNKKKTQLISSYFDFSTFLRPVDKLVVDTKEFENFTEKVGMNGREENELAIEGHLSYENKFTEKTSIEGGIALNLDHIPYVGSSNGTFNNERELIPYALEPLDKSVNFKQDVYASFITFKSGWGKFDLKTGLRCELTDRKSNYSYKDPKNLTITTPASNSFIDLFPSAHLLYSITEDHQFGMNYSRRVERPRYWRLIPLPEYLSPYEYKIGNGNLLPAYSNSFDFFYKKSWDKDFIGIEVFSRNTADVMQTYYRTDTANTMMITYENVGDSWSTGAEIMLGVDIFEWWNFNASSSLYDYRLTVDIEEVERTEKQLYSKSRINNTFLLPKNFTFKWDFNYNSPTIRAQYKKDSYFSSNMSLQKSILDNKWRFALSWTNVFNSIKYDIKTKGADFNINNSYHLKPYASFKITYSFDNQK